MGLLRLLFRSLTRPPRGPRRASTTRATVQATTVSRTATSIRTTTTTVTVRDAEPVAAPTVLTGYAYVIDGDTIVINNTRIRVAGIDAPELDHPWGKKAKWAVVAMCKGQRVTAHLDGALTHDRVVASCYLEDGRDIAAELVKQGLAIDWPKYSDGKYRQYEVDGVRKRLWRAHQRQLGRFPPQR